MTRRQRTVLAVVLWLVLAGVVWNVVFDRLVVIAGRQYSHDAAVVFRSTGRYLLINEMMPAAVSHAARVASLVAGAIAAVALLLIGVASRRGTAPDATRPTARH